MEPQKTSSSQSNLEKENQSWWHHSPRFQILLQSYSNQNNMVLTLKNRHIDQWNRTDKNRNKPTHIQSINLRERSQEYTMGRENILFHKWCWENCTAICKRNESGAESYTIPQN